MRLLLLELVAACFLASCGTHGPRSGPRDTVYFPYLESLTAIPAEVHANQPVQLRFEFSAKRNPLIFNDPDLSWDWASASSVSNPGERVSGFVIVDDAHAGGSGGEAPGSTYEFETEFSSPGIQELVYATPASHEDGGVSMELRFPGPGYPLEGNQFIERTFIINVLP